ncbi:hypothetical protein PQR75_26270 [Paraburkholderia fungorum]|uniref:hypothetical protein n=1 Tax=Paraburkholderia fungorum TaxID=134537 RepID=UPI0038B8A835
MIEFWRHPLSAAFPSFSDDDLDALVDDIRQFGQRESGILLDGMILDGWNRYQACVRLGVEFNYLEFDDEFPGTDPRAYVKSKNYHRRHMTASQRAASIVALSQWAPPGNPNLATVARLPTNAELAREADVSPRTISHAKAAHEAGLGEAVISGALSLRDADAQIKASRAPTIPAQKSATAHDAAAELAAPTDAVASKPSSRTRADEESSRAVYTREPVAEEPAIDPAAVALLRDEIKELQFELESARDVIKRLSARNEVLEKAVDPDADARFSEMQAELDAMKATRDLHMDKSSELAGVVKRQKRGLNG